MSYLAGELELGQHGRQVGLSLLAEVVVRVLDDLAVGLVRLLEPAIASRMETAITREMKAGGVPRINSWLRC